MRKIGILTFHRAVNYGAVFQMYALCKAIERLGGSPEVIDYRCKMIEDFYYKPASKDYSIKMNLKSFLYYGKQKRRNTAFEGFQNNLIPLSKEKYYNSSEMKVTEDLYDAFIVGSDQVWNYKCIRGDKAFLLDFVNAGEKKNSYAASLGKMTEEELELMNFSRYLSEYNQISVREKEGFDIIKKCSKKDVDICLDPTLLLEKIDWNEISQYEETKKFVLVYSVNLPRKVIEIGRKLALEKGLKLIVVTLENKYSPMKNEENQSFCTPQRLLGYFENAEYVVTNSFHGTVFSIINQREFITIKNDKTGLDNSRLETLLESLGLESRLVDDYRFNDKIDYDKVANNLRVLKEKSLEYLERIVVSK
ncbi:MAG: polysaccharide pyruvyl transferase family protein [Lachnospiraceae bacterium]|nr:polysaccharide pyruvyl transferase family protein [Lachnospiraceae bacterium]